MGFVLCDYADAADARVEAVGQRKIDDAELSAEVDRGFGSLVCQLLETAASAAREHQCDGAFGKLAAGIQFCCHRLSPLWTWFRVPSFWRPVVGYASYWPGLFATATHATREALRRGSTRVLRGSALSVKR